MPGLVILESGAKASRLQSLLDSEEYGMWRCIHSGGHITELDPSDQNFMVRKTFEGPSRKPVCRARTKRMWRNVEIVDRILKSMKRHDMICIASDPDREGESIAADLFTLGEQLGIPMYRIRMQEISARAFYESFEQKLKLDDNLVRAARLRAVADLWIGTRISDLVKLTVGRVRTPLVSELNRLHTSRSSHTEFGVRSVEPVFPMTTWDLCRSFPCTAPSAIMERAQSLYTNGYLSYPRTDSIRLSEESMQKLWGMLPRSRRSHLAGLLDERAHRDIENGFVQDAHEALHVLAPYNGDDTLSAAMCARVKESTDGFFNGAVAMIRVRKTIREASVNADYGTLVDLMRSNGIGRPSTIGSTIDAPIKDGQIRVDKGPDGGISISVSELGGEMLERVETICPDLSDPETTSRIEHRLHRIAQGIKEEQNALLLDAVSLTEKAEGSAHKLGPLLAVPAMLGSDIPEQEYDSSLLISSRSGF